jgi:hypothetical protein
MRKTAYEQQLALLAAEKYDTADKSGKDNVAMLASSESTPSTDLLQQQEQILSKTEFLCVEWHDSVHNEELGLSQFIELATIQNLQGIRQFANNAVIDVLLFLTPEFRERILSRVCHKLNTAFRKFCEINPYFVSLGAPTSIIGHSLGSVILFDLLSTSMGVQFPIHSFFALGSPIGLFQSVRNVTNKLSNLKIDVSLFGMANRQEDNSKVSNDIPHSFGSGMIF